MKPPIYQIVANDADITAKIQDRFLRMTVHDGKGIESDTVTITIDNRGNVIQPLSTGATLAVSIGTGSVLVPKGVFKVTELEEELDSDDLIIHGTAADTKGSIKSPKDRTFDSITYGELVNQIAIENNLQPVISDELAKIQFDHIDQKAESDLNLLTRLGRQYGAIAKPVAERLLVTGQGKGKTASGQEMPLEVIADAHNSSGRVVTKERDNYQSVVAHWFDEPAQQKRQVKAGDGEPSLTLKQEYTSEDEALKAATAELEERQRGKKTFSLTRPLSPTLGAEYRIQVINHKPVANGLWVVESADHTVERDRVSETRLELVTPK